MSIECELKQIKLNWLKPNDKKKWSTTENEQNMISNENLLSLLCKMLNCGKIRLRIIVAYSNSMTLSGVKTNKTGIWSWW